MQRPANLSKGTVCDLHFERQRCNETLLRSRITTQEIPGDHTSFACYIVIWDSANVTAKTLN